MKAASRNELDFSAVALLGDYSYSMQSFICVMFFMLLFVGVDWVMCVCVCVCFFFVRHWVMLVCEVFVAPTVTVVISVCGSNCSQHRSSRSTFNMVRWIDYWHIDLFLLRFRLLNFSLDSANLLQRCSCFVWTHTGAMPSCLHTSSELALQETPLCPHFQAEREILSWF